MSLRVLSITGAATLQGPANTGLRHVGAPYGGAWDREAYGLANALVGAEADALALELPMFGGTFVCESTVRVAVVGAVGPVAINGVAGLCNACYTLKVGSKLEIGPYATGAISYLSVLGGWRGVGGQSVKRGDVLESVLEKPFVDRPTAKLDRPPKSLQDRLLRVVAGPQLAAYGESALSGKFEASGLRDRSGLRMFGDVENYREIASEPACEGAVQLTPSGERILIGPDGPTIGGYPKLGVLIEADLSRIAQLREKERVEFRIVDRETALRLSARAKADLDRRVKLIRTALEAP